MPKFKVGDPIKIRTSASSINGTITAVGIHSYLIEAPNGDETMHPIKWTDKHCILVKKTTKMYLYRYTRAGEWRISTRYYRDDEHFKRYSACGENSSFQRIDSSMIEVEE